LKRVLILLLSLLPASLVLLSCGTTPSSSSSRTSGLKYRLFISDSVSAGTSSAGVYIVDAQTDIRPILSPIGAGNTPGMMVVSPNRAQTLVFSGSGTQSSDNQLTFINNAAETAAGRVSLRGMTESFVISPDSSAAYVAVPTAPVVGRSPGVMQVVSMGSVSLTGEVDVPAIHFLSMNNSGNRILGFSDVLSSLGAPCLNQVPSFVFVITPSDIGVQPCPVIPVPGFDHPVKAFFSSDDNTAFIVNCGAECGGATASVQTLDLTTCSPATSTCGSPGLAVPVPAASEAFLDGSTMYLAGSYVNPSGVQPCPGQTVFTQTCGSLTIFDLSTMSVTASGIAITDGFHNRIALGANGRLYIGARTCTETVGVSGCLSIYNTQTGKVVIPPANGDVTGIEPITKRTVVYVIQGGSIEIYDTATDALQKLQIKNVVGQFIDAKVVDF
jgi:hypothetical protein